jgi:hypothetical protein
MRLPQVTTRQWMKAVAVIALVLLQVELLRRFDVYVGKAKYYEGRVRIASIRNKAEDAFGVFAADMLDAQGKMTPEHERIYDMLRAYYEKLAQKYRHAAFHPWEAVEPDPPLLTRESVRLWLGEELGTATTPEPASLEK